MVIEELVAVLGYDLKGEQNLARFNAGLERASALAQRLAAVMVAAGTIAAGAMIGLGKSVIETSAEFEGFQASLETIEGSADKAKTSLDWITKFAATTPYEIAELTKAFIKLKNAGIDPTDGTLTALGDTASAMNVPLSQAVEAMTDAMTNQFERLKEFGITSSQKGDQVTFTWRKNGKELTKVVKKSGLDIKKFLLENFGDRFNGAMIRQSKTWNGMMSNLADSWTIFKKTIGDGGFFENVKGRLAGLLDYIGKLKDDGTLGRWAQTLSDGLTAGVDFAAGQIQGLIGDLKFLFGWIKMNPEWWGPIKTGLMAIGAIMFPKVAALLVLQDVLRWMEGKGSVIGDFAKSLSELTGLDPGSSGTLLASLATAGAAFLLFGGTFSKVAAGIRALAVALGLMGGAQAIAGTAAMTSLTGGSIAAGLLSISAAAAAAAASIKLFYDAWKSDEKLNDALKEKVAPSLFDWFADNILGGNRPDQAFANDNPTLGGQNKPTPSGEKPLKVSNDLMDYKLAEVERETRRARYANWGSALENARFNAQRAGAGGANAVVHAPTTVTVNMPVQQVVGAANAAANAVREKVSSALKSLPTHPTRTTPSPTF